MYRITSEIATFLTTHMKDPGIPGWIGNVSHPFKPTNKHSIGIIDPMSAIGTELDYVIEGDFVIDGLGIDHKPNVDGCWLYRRDELQKPTETVKIPRNMFDLNMVESTEILDVTDCCVKIPNSVNKLTAITIKSIEDLLEIEPGLLKCLKDSPKS